MNAENPQFFLPPELRRTEQEIIFQRYVRILPKNSSAVNFPHISGLRGIELDILPQGLVLAVHNHIDVHTPPIFHEKDGERTSDAEYYVNEYETPDGHIIYVSELKPNSKTSKHSHPSPLREFYFTLGGEAFRNGRPMGRISMIDSEEDHQIETREKSVLLGILMENGAKVPKDQRHIM